MFQTPTFLMVVSGKTHGGIADLFCGRYYRCTPIFLHVNIATLHAERSESPFFSKANPPILDAWGPRKSLMVSTFFTASPPKLLVGFVPNSDNSGFSSFGNSNSKPFSTTFQHHTSNVFFIFLTQTLPFHELPTGFQHGVWLGIGQPYIVQTQKCGKPIDSKSRNVGNPYIFHVKMWETHPFHIHLAFQHVRHRRHARGRRGRSGRILLGGCGDGRGSSGKFGILSWENHPCWRLISINIH